MWTFFALFGYNCFYCHRFCCCCCCCILRHLQWQIIYFMPTSTFKHTRSIAKCTHFIGNKRKKKYVANSLTRRPLSKRWKCSYFSNAYSYITLKFLHITLARYKYPSIKMNIKLVVLSSMACCCLWPLCDWTEMNISHCVGSCLMKTGSTCTTIHLFFDWILI